MAKKNTPATSTKPSAAPGSTGDAAATQAVKKGRVPYPGLKPDAEGKSTVKLESVPADFDPKAHKPLKKTDFASEATFLDMRADEMEKKAASIRQEAELIRKGGGKKAAAKAKRLQKMVERMEELKKELAESGIDTEALLATLNE